MVTEYCGDYFLPTQLAKRRLVYGFNFFFKQCIAAALPSTKFWSKYLLLVLLPPPALGRFCLSAPSGLLSILLLCVTKLRLNALVPAVIKFFTCKLNCTGVAGDGVVYYWYLWASIAVSRLLLLVVAQLEATITLLSVKKKYSVSTQVKYIFRLCVSRLFDERKRKKNTFRKHIRQKTADNRRIILIDVGMFDRAVKIH